jgi:hypothetical protein
MAILTNVVANNLLDYVTGVAAAAAAPTGPMKLRLMTANGSEATGGTQIAAGAAQTITFTTTTGRSSPSTNAQNFTGCTVGAVVVGVEVWDSAGTPKRWAWGPLSTTIDSTGNFSIAAGGVVIAFP